MNTIYNKFLIVLAIILLVGGVYVYFSNNLETQAAVGESALSSSNDLSTSGASTGVDNSILDDTSFLYTLTSLTKIKISTAIFKNTAFNALVDNTVLLEPSITGRPNPFAPISNGVGFTLAEESLVVTNPPDQITTKGALLNGTTNNTEGVTSVYFEYGPTPTLGKVTPQTKQSLIGTFGSNITGLTPKSAYFFRAVAKVSGKLHYGEIISFSTN